MIEQNNVDAQFDEKDIEQIFGGASVLANAGGDVSEPQSVRQQERVQEQSQPTHASANLT